MNNNEYITKAQAIALAESLRPIAGNGITDAFINGIEGVEGCRLLKHKEPVDGKTIAIKLSPKIEKKLSQGWISTKDRMPEHGEEVLCKTIYSQEVLQWDGRSNVWCGLTKSYVPNYVSHWMPLPEPPKEEHQ